MENSKVIRGKTLGAWKLYSEEQKMQTPIQVLKYISILEEELEVKNSVVLADVSNQRELLNGFRKFINESEKEGYVMPYLIDKYLEII